MTSDRVVHGESKSIAIPNWVKAILVFAPYFVAARFAAVITATDGIASPVWPGSGIAFAGLLIVGRRYWPSIFVAAFLVNYQISHSLLVSILLSFGDTLEPIIAITLFKRYNLNGNLSRAKDISGLIVFGAFLSTFIDAIYGTTVSYLAGIVQASNFLMTGLTWWTGDMLGDLVIAPLILVWAHPSRERYSRVKSLEWAVLFALTFLTSIFIFHKESIPQLHVHLFTYFVFPFLLWGGLRFDQRAVATLTFLIAFVGVYATINGSGPFVWNDLISNLLSLLPFLGILSTSALLFTAVVGEQKETQENLALAIQARDDVLAMVSHDLKNPLSSILLNLSFLSSKANEIKNGGFQEKIESIQNVAKNMQILIGNALDIAIDVSRFSVNAKSESAKNIVEECIKMLSPLAEAKSLKLETKFENPSLTVQCDREMILRVLSNLIGNAIKFTPKNGEIFVSASEKDKKVVFTIEDTGRGIDKNEIPHLFDRFWQAKKKNKDGTGLGLSIAKAIVEAHHGEIWAENRLDRGSSFNFSLPQGEISVMRQAFRTMG